MSQVEQFRASLKAAADSITQQFPTVPLPIGRVCRSMGVSVARKSTVPALKCYMIFDSDFGGPQILLPSEERSPSYARFCVAHELAHLIIYKKYNVKPEGKSDYWKHEALCDEFARDLLLPHNFVKDFVASYKSPYILAMPFVLSQTTRAPRNECARRITDVSGIMFFSASIEYGHMFIEKTSLPGKASRNAKISLADSFLADVGLDRDLCSGVVKGVDGKDLRKNKFSVDALKSYTIYFEKKNDSINIAILQEGEAGFLEQLSI